MGAAPGEAYLALCLPPGAELGDAVALLQGARELADACGVTWPEATFPPRRC